MNNQKNRSLEQYMLVGAEMRLFKEIGTRLCVDASEVLTVPETEKLLRVRNKIDTICSDIEGQMFQYHPEINDDYVDVFYGNLHDEPRTAVDAEVVKKARAVIEKIFKRK